MAELIPEIIEEKPLSVAETKRLAELETVIEENFKGFVAVGSALAEIREQRLYRKQYPTFEDYCRNIWDVHKNTANQYIAASKVVGNLTAIAVEIDIDKNGTIDAQGDTTFPLPANEAQARELAKLSEEDQLKVWKMVVNLSRNSNTPITAKAVKKAVIGYKGQAVDKQIDKATKTTRENKKDFQSEPFTVAFDAFFEQIRIEKESGWRKTSRQTVYRLLSGLIDVVSEAVPGTLDTYGCTMELSDREKLKKAGFRIFRLDVKTKTIEEWQHRDNWTVYAEYQNAKELHDQYRLLLENHTHLKG